MSLRVAVCDSCGRAAFPPPLLCPHCSNRDWNDEQVDSGTLEAVSDLGEVRVGAVRLARGPVAIARVEGNARAGVEVQLTEDGGIPVARA